MTRYGRSTQTEFKPTERADYVRQDTAEVGTEDVGGLGPGTPPRKSGSVRLTTVRHATVRLTMVRHATVTRRRCPQHRLWRSHAARCAAGRYAYCRSSLAGSHPTDGSAGLGEKHPVEAARSWQPTHLAAAKDGAGAAASPFRAGRSDVVTQPKRSSVHVACAAVHSTPAVAGRLHAACWCMTSRVVACCRV